MNFNPVKKPSVCIIILLMIVSFIPSIAGAFEHGEGMHHKRMDRKGHHRSELGIWRNPELVQILELSEEQVNELRDADFTSRENCLELKSELDGLHLKMDKAMSKATVDEKAVLLLAKQLSDVRGKLFARKIKARLAAEKILNEDQVYKLKLHLMEHKRRGPGMCKEQNLYSKH